MIILNIQVFALWFHEFIFVSYDYCLDYDRENRIAHDGEFSDSDDEGDNRRNVTIEKADIRRPVDPTPIPGIQELRSPEHQAWSESTQQNRNRSPPISAGAARPASPISVVPVSDATSSEAPQPMSIDSEPTNQTTAQDTEMKDA